MCNSPFPPIGFYAVLCWWEVSHGAPHTMHIWLPRMLVMLWRLFQTFPHSTPGWICVNAHFTWWNGRCGHAPQGTVHPSLKMPEYFLLSPGLQVWPFKGIDAEVFEGSRYPACVWRVSLCFSQVPSLEPCCRQSSLLCPSVSQFG